jgi:hypothetical protein
MPDVRAWAAIDFLCCLLLVVYVLVAPPVQAQSIETFGRYVIVLAWPDRAHSDVDLWVRDPGHRVVYYAQTRNGLMHLEEDDLGIVSDTISGITVHRNLERVVVKGIVPGEYIVNVHLYNRLDRHPLRAEVTLYRLQGADRKMASRMVTLTRQGQEETAFRFSLSPDGRLTGMSRLPAALVTG